MQPGPIGAAMLSMKTPAPEMFRSGRQFAAWIGLTPKDHSTAGKVRLGVITRAGDEGLLAYWWSAQQPSSGISETPEAGAY
jgi:transposase